LAHLATRLLQRTIAVVEVGAAGPPRLLLVVVRFVFVRGVELDVALLNDDSLLLFLSGHRFKFLVRVVFVFNEHIILRLRLLELVPTAFG
jgi:hypothetical protein